MTPSKLWQLLRCRPLYLLRLVRERWLFAQTRFLLCLLRLPGIALGRGARVQALSSVMADAGSGGITIGARSVIYENARIEARGQGRITIGENCIIGDARIYSRASITLGKGVITSWNVFMQDFAPHPIEPELRARQILDMTGGSRTETHQPLKAEEWNFPASSITVGDNVWIGANVTILQGAHIGRDCILAAGSVVGAGDYPDRSIIAGVPAKVVKTV